LPIAFTVIQTKITFVLRYSGGRKKRHNLPTVIAQAR